MTSFSPREIVSELDRFIVGQHEAKRAVAIALRNRWRRQQLAPELREEVLPKNILMIGPTGVRQDRDLAAPGEAGAGAVRQGRGDQIHRGRLCRPRCRADRARSRRDRDRHDPRAAAQGGRAEGRARRRGARARRAGRLERRRRHPAEVSQDAARGRARRPRDRDRGSGECRGESADLRDPRHAGRADGDAQSRRHLRQGVRHAAPSQSG